MDGTVRVHAIHMVKTNRRATRKAIIPPGAPDLTSDLEEITTSQLV